MQATVVPLSLGDDAELVEELYAAVDLWPADRVEDPRGRRYFGMRLLTALRLFQSAHGLTVDGIAGAHTWGAVWAGRRANPDRLPLLRVGSKGPDVVTWHFAVGLMADDEFTKQSSRIAGDLQVMTQLPVTGIVDPYTWRASLRALL